MYYWGAVSTEVLRLTLMAWREDKAAIAALELHTF